MLVSVLVMLVSVFRVWCSWLGVVSDVFVSGELMNRVWCIGSVGVRCSS